VSERPFSQASLPLILAHRGAPTERPENTLAAFEAALDARAGAVEFDVRVTSDGHAVVIHDAAVDRTTDGGGLVRELTLAEVLRLRIDWPGGRSVAVPTLQEVLASLSGRIAVDIEIKNVPGDPDFDPNDEVAVGLVHRALDDVAFVGDVIVSSFNPLSIARCRELAPHLPTGLLTDRSVEADAGLTFAHAQGHARGSVRPGLAPAEGPVGSGRGRMRGAESLTIYTAADRVRAAQQALAQKRYYRGAADGTLNDATRRALFQFQVDNGLSATGNLDGRTAQALGMSLGGGVAGAALSNEQASSLRRDADALVTQLRDELGVSSAGRLSTARPYAQGDLDLWFALSAFADNAAIYEQIVRNGGNRDAAVLAGKELVNAARRVDTAVPNARSSAQVPNAWTGVRRQLSAIDTP
jgi:glycerophosphoryl diester phosphodiesterase